MFILMFELPYDVYLCVKKWRNQNFTCVKYTSFEQADMIYKNLTDEGSVDRFKPSAMVPVPKVVPNYFVKPFLEHKVKNLLVKVDIEDLF